MRGRFSATNPLAPRTVLLSTRLATVAFSALVTGSVVGCALLRASTPAEAAAAAILDARQANEVAARSCALYRAGVLLGEVPEDAGVTRSCDEAFP